MDFSEELRAYGASITYEAADVIDILHRNLDQRDAEITQLRADLEQERELADRLYSAIEYIDDYCLAYPELESVSAVSSSAIDYVDTRRNK